MQPLVRVAGLSHRYGARTALDAVDLEVAPGEVVGLVGPNGSGKTTLLKVLAGLLAAHEGTAEVCGVDPATQPTQVMRRARFAFAPPALYDALTAREHLVHLTRIGARVPADELDATLGLVGLAERAHDRVQTFSFGMRQRLVLALALLPRPELLVLDEPTDGLDPLAVLELRALLKRLRAEHGIAVLLSSHLLIEIEELVDRMLVLREGRTLFHGTPAEMLEGTRRLRIGADDVERARELLAARGLDAALVDGELELGDGALESLGAHEAARLFAAGGVELTGYRVHRPTLEQALLARLRAEDGR